ncbi:BadF/BadG/BcrA/BcrD ATPase family protein [Paenibacillus castaneae]|nr:BadF/BadG/BcrA/BcrD ATPase family protein [Paenibacillus castaneae]
MEQLSKDIVIGIDGGGTHTRVMAVDLNGNVLSYIEKGASSIYKDLQAKQNVHQAIEEALHLSGKKVEQVHALTAGIAGLDSDSDLEWVVPLTELEGLNCRKEHVNDAVVAHSGALLTEPGIVVIAGTGSNIYAINEEGQRIKNYDLTHYAASAARFLAYDATFELLAGNIDESDQELVRDIVKHWNVSSVEEMSQLARYGFAAAKRERDKRFAQLAPTITAAALNNCKLAKLVCDRAIHQIAVGVEPEIKVSLIGSVVNSPYFQSSLAIRMNEGKNKKYRLIQPKFSPAAGAVLLALKQLEIPIDEPLLRNLSHHPRSING